MKELIAGILQKSLKENKVEIEKEKIISLLEIPPSPEMGDYAFPCFFLINELKEEPHQIAIELRARIGNPPSDFEDIQTVGPYINFFVDRKLFSEELINKILKQKDKFGKLSTGKGNRTMVEFLSANTNKPLHLGHLRNMSIGESVSRIFEFNSEKVIRANLYNDRGIHICKSMAAYKLYGKNKHPGKQKPDHFVGDFYVKFNEKSKKNEKLELESHRLLQNYEKGDKETIALWQKMNKWCLDGHKKTYEKFGISFDKEYYESKIYTKGKEIIEEGVKKGIFKREKKGGVVIRLGKGKSGKKFLLRPDGTSVYITQDIYLAKLKFEKFKLTKSFYVVGNEQDYHFEVLFKILEKLGFNSKGLKHLSYGMVNLPAGKLKSREGTKVDGDDLIDKVQELVRKELHKREKLSKRELESRSLKIALASIKYFLLRIGIKKNMVFNPKESINFEGETGPYLLYSFARANSILKKIKSKNNKFKIEQLNQSEIKLVKKLSQFPEVVLNAYSNLNPSLIANYSHQLSQIFNEFYHSSPVIGSEQEAFRLKLVKSFKQVLENSLNLLGIETLEKM